MLEDDLFPWERSLRAQNRRGSYAKLRAALRRMQAEAPGLYERVHGRDRRALAWFAIVIPGPIWIPVEAMSEDFHKRPQKSALGVCFRWLRIVPWWRCRVYMHALVQAPLRSTRAWRSRSRTPPFTPGSFRGGSTTSSLPLDRPGLRGDRSARPARL